MRPLILFHASCADGFCSAWVAHRLFGGNADYVPVQYGQEPPEIAWRDIFIIDFSYKRPVLMEMARKAKNVTVLDHHHTAAEDLAGGYEVNTPSTGFRQLEANLFVKFDMSKSGARLTWEHFFPGEPSPWLVDLTEDRDLWKWSLPQSREVNACLASWKWDFEEWDLLATDNTAVVTFAQQGDAILRYQKQVVDAQCKNAREVEIDGHRVLAVNATVLISEIAGQLAKDRPFGASFFIRDDGKKVWSLRSREGGIDVSEIAKRRGGGGHRNAAGFTEEPK